MTVLSFCTYLRPWYRTIWYEGFASGAQGYPKDDCIYAIHPDRNAWLKGWLAGHARRVSAPSPSGLGDLGALGGSPSPRSSDSSPSGLGDLGALGGSPSRRWFLFRCACGATEKHVCHWRPRPRPCPKCGARVSARLVDRVTGQPLGHGPRRSATSDMSNPTNRSDS
jgi:ribosome modulation factor